MLNGASIVASRCPAPTHSSVAAQHAAAPSKFQELPMRILAIGKFTALRVQVSKDGVNPTQ